MNKTIKTLNKLIKETAFISYGYEDKLKYQACLEEIERVRAKIASVNFNRNLTTVTANQAIIKDILGNWNTDSEKPKEKEEAGKYYQQVMYEFDEMHREPKETNHIPSAGLNGK